MMKSILTQGKAIEGVQLHALKKHKDARGSFSEVFQDAWGSVIKPCQWSAVESEANVFRGCHLHLRHDEYFCLLQGEALVGLRDERLDSATKGHWQLYHLYGDDLAAITFPIGLVHGWYFLKPSLHLQAVSESYVDYGADDNFGVRWDDPDLEIPWGIQDPILTQRADAFGSLKALRKIIYSE